MLYLASNTEMLIAVFALTKEKKKVEITMRRNFSYEKNIFMQILSFLIKVSMILSWSPPGLNSQYSSLREILSFKHNEKTFNAD